MNPSKQRTQTPDTRKCAPLAATDLAFVNGGGHGMGGGVFGAVAQLERSTGGWSGNGRCAEELASVPDER